eukprot:COSAG03_NODE_552_length_6970_cov_232.041140_8_plen_49_part_00
MVHAEREIERERERERKKERERVRVSEGQRVGETCPATARSPSRRRRG